MYNHILDTQSFKIKKQTRFLNFFWSGFLIYTLCSILALSGYVSFKICQAFQVLGLIFIFVGFFNLIQFKIENVYLKITFTLYCTWLFTIIGRGLEFPLNYNFAKDFIFGGGGHGLTYFTPLILLFPRNFTFYKKVFDIIIIFGILYLLLDIIFINKLLSSGQDTISQGIVENLSEISLPLGFILLTYIYHSNKRNLFAIGLILLTLLFTIIRARRGLIIITSSIIVSSYLLYFIKSKKKYLIIYLSILISALGALYASQVYKINNNRIFSFLAERGKEDSRTGVELYFYDDMKTKDWIIGKGINGEYFCPDMSEDQITNYRNVIETGYLQIILKGGIISLSLLLLIAIPACIKGIFFSKNILSKAGGIWIFLFITNLYPQNAVSFDLSYLLVWISIGICYSDKIRQMSDHNIRNQILLLNNKTNLSE